MPKPTYDLDRKKEPITLLAILVGLLAIVAFGGAIALIQRIGMRLSS